MHIFLEDLFLMVWRFNDSGDKIVFWLYFKFVIGSIFFKYNFCEGGGDYN